jgi:hypothetical protein
MAGVLPAWRCLGKRLQYREVGGEMGLSSKRQARDAPGPIRRIALLRPTRAG